MLLALMDYWSYYRFGWPGQESDFTGLLMAIVFFLYEFEYQEVRQEKTDAGFMGGSFSDRPPELSLLCLRHLILTHMRRSET